MQCLEVQSLIAPYLEKKLELSQEIEVASHIRGCKRCREELEFYFVVYVTTGMIDDRHMSGDYEAEAEFLLERTEKEWNRTIKLNKARRFRLIAILILLGVGLSFGVGKSIAESEPEPVSAVRPSFAFKEIEMPEELNFVGNAIQKYQNLAKDFVLSQQVRHTERQKLWERDAAVMRAMKEDREIQYTLPDAFVESWGSFSERIITGREPDYKLNIKMTIRSETKGQLP